ncbi:MAG: polyprenyl synthetase family protein [Candidatus Altiarchaeota archaeon]
MDEMKIYMKETAEKLQPILLSYLKLEEKAVREMVEHPIRAGGKRVRPALLLLANEIVGGSPKKMLPAAASVELLHTFTLVHDDMMDHDLERRGKPTVHALWGDEMGLIVGDTLYSIAFQAMLDLKKNNIPDLLILKAVEELVRANAELHEGQILDMVYSKRDEVKEEQYMRMIGKKTGALLESSLRIGAILGGGSVKQVDALGNFGRYIGLSFQIKDDILGLTADEKELGKPVGSDICEGKKSLPVLYAMEHAKKEDRKKLLAILDKKEACDLNAAMRIIRETNSIDYAIKKLENLTSKAKKELEIFEESKVKKRLLDLADFLIERRF